MAGYEGAAFVVEKGLFGWRQKRTCANGWLLVCEKGLHSQPMQSHPKKKSFSQLTAAPISHYTQTNVQLQILSAKPHCELAVQQPIFETLQSCVCSAASLSHRFKSSPAIPGKPAIPGAAGYLMNAGHFRENHVSSGDLNRGRRTESRVLFGYFLHDAKSDNPFSLQRTSRFCKPRFSSSQWRLRTNKLKSFRRPAAGFFLLFVKYKK